MKGIFKRIGSFQWSWQGIGGQAFITAAIILRSGVRVYLWQAFKTGEGISQGWEASLKDAKIKCLRKLPGSESL